MTAFSRKILLLLALATISMVSADNRSFRKVRKLYKVEAVAEEDDEPKGVTITRSKGKDGAADEMDVDVKLQTCEQDSKECKSIYGDEDVEDVSRAMFTSLMAEEMVSAFEKDENDDDNRMLEVERNLNCYVRCRYYRYCRYGRCHILRKCRAYC